MAFKQESLTQITVEDTQCFFSIVSLYDLGSIVLQSINNFLYVVILLKTINSSAEIIDSLLNQEWVL